MARSTTTFLKLSRVRSHQALAQVLVRLMMVCNDITLAEDALARWSENNARNREGRKIGARMYFLRLQIAHLHEAIKIVDQIKKGFSDSVARCDVRTQESFKTLQEMLQSGDLRTIAKDMRDKLTFHYDQNAVEQSLASLASRHGDFETVMSSGTEAHLCYFELGDRVSDNMVVRQVWNIPLTMEVRSAADDVAVRLGKIREVFVDFAANFVLRHLRR